MIGYFEVPNNPTIYQLRYVYRIKKINKQTIDPAKNIINERKFVKPEEFFNYVKIENYRLIMDEAVKLLNSQ